MGGKIRHSTPPISLTVVDPATFALAFRNASTINNYGFNTLFEGSTGQWGYGASLTGGYARRTTPDGAVKLPVAPQVFGNARASYDLPGAWPTLALATSFVGSRLADRANDGNFPVTPRAPFSLTLRTTISGDISGIPGLSYRFSFNYVTAAHFSARLTLSAVQVPVGLSSGARALVSLVFRVIRSVQTSCAYGWRSR